MIELTFVCKWLNELTATCDRLSLYNTIEIPWWYMLQDCEIILFMFVDCGVLSNPANGNVDITSGTTFGEIATYSCNPGFVRNGAVTTECQSDGSWSNTPPSCDRIGM